MAFSLASAVSPIDSQRPRPCARMLLALLAALMLLTLPGCRGCLREDPLTRLKREEEEKKKRREKPKPDFEAKSSGRRRQLLVKNFHHQSTIDSPYILTRE